MSTFCESLHKQRVCNIFLLRGDPRRHLLKFLPGISHPRTESDEGLGIYVRRISFSLSAFMFTFEDDWLQICAVTPKLGFLGVVQVVSET